MPLAPSVEAALAEAAADAAGAARGANAAYIEEQRRVLAQFRADAMEAGAAKPQVVARVPPASAGDGGTACERCVFSVLLHV